jgi:hypothetical protein
MNISYDYSGKISSFTESECDRIEAEANTIDDINNMIEASEAKSEIKEHVTFRIDGIAV